MGSLYFFKRIQNEILKILKQKTYIQKLDAPKVNPMNTRHLFNILERKFLPVNRFVLNNLSTQVGSRHLCLCKPNPSYPIHMYQIPVDKIGRTENPYRGDVCQSSGPPTVSYLSHTRYLVFGPHFMHLRSKQNVVCLLSRSVLKSRVITCQFLHLGKQDP